MINVWVWYDYVKTKYGEKALHGRFQMILIKTFHSILKLDLILQIMN